MREWLYVLLRKGRCHSVSKGQNSPYYTACETTESKSQEKRGKNNVQPARFCWKLFTAGLVCLSTAVLSWILKPYDLILNYKLEFGEGGESFEMWRKPPVDVLVKVFLFNITNADAFLAGQEPLRVEEIGPYVYKERLEHANVTFNSNGTLSGIPKHPLSWAPELSNGTEEDIVVVPNLAVLAFAQLVSDMSIFVQLAVNVLITQTESRPIVRMTARQYMFAYESSLVKLGNKFLPTWINFKSVGILDRMYNFDGDFFTVFTGEIDVRQSGLLDTYNGDKHLPYWEGEHCSGISGSSDSAKYQSAIGPEDKLRFFRRSMCRVMTLVHNGTVNVGGLRAYVYHIEENSMDNGKYNPENKCYCRKGKCLPEGLIDATDCYYGAPIAVSLPHFYKGDPSLLEGVVGSNPDPEKHHTYYHVVPESGLPVQVASRFQINIFLGDLSRTPTVKRFSDLVVPCFWVDVGVNELPSELATYFYILLVVLPTAQTVSDYLLLLAGCSLLILCLLRWNQRARPSPANLPRPRPGRRSQQVRASKFLDRPQDGAHRDLNWYAYHGWFLDHSQETDV